MDGSAADPANIVGTFADGSMAGKVALIRRGACYFTSKTINSQNAGAVGVIVYNDHRPGTVTMSGPEVGITIHAMFIAGTDGDALNAAVTADPTTTVHIHCDEGSRLGPTQPAAADCPTDYAGYVGTYYFYDIVSSGTEILDDSWANPLNTWNHDDGYVDVPFPFDFNWFMLVEPVFSIGTNGMITFGTGHLRNGGSEPIPCVSASLCDGVAYGSHANHADWGVDGVVAPFWADINPGSSLDGVEEEGAVYFQLYTSSAVVMWNLCTYWTPDNNPTAQTFEAIMFADGSLVFSYQDMAPEAGHLSWSEESIGYEDKSGTLGYQIAYSFTVDPNAIPADETTFVIPSSCTSLQTPNPSLGAACLGNTDCGDGVSHGVVCVGDSLSGGVTGTDPIVPGVCTLCSDLMPLADEAAGDWFGCVAAGMGAMLWHCEEMCAHPDVIAGR
jgi:hypothetical protein